MDILLISCINYLPPHSAANWFSEDSKLLQETDKNECCCACCAIFFNCVIKVEKRQKKREEEEEEREIKYKGKKEEKAK